MIDGGGAACCRAWRSIEAPVKQIGKLDVDIFFFIFLGPPPPPPRRGKSEEEPERESRVRRRRSADAALQGGSRRSGHHPDGIMGQRLPTERHSIPHPPRGGAEPKRGGLQMGSSGIGEAGMVRAERHQGRRARPPVQAVRRYHRQSAGAYRSRLPSTRCAARSSMPNPGRAWSPSRPRESPTSR